MFAVTWAYGMDSVDGIVGLSTGLENGLETGPLIIDALKD